jgi:hypothetical protein
LFCNAFSTSHQIPHRIALLPYSTWFTANTTRHRNSTGSGFYSERPSSNRRTSHTIRRSGTSRHSNTPDSGYHDDEFSDELSPEEIEQIAISEAEEANRRHSEQEAVRRQQDEDAELQRVLSASMQAARNEARTRREDDQEDIAIMQSIEDAQGEALRREEADQLRLAMKRSARDAKEATRRQQDEAIRRAAAAQAREAQEEAHRQQEAREMQLAIEMSVVDAEERERKRQLFIEAERLRRAVERSQAAAIEEAEASRQPRQTVEGSVEYNEPREKSRSDVTQSQESQHGQPKVNRGLEPSSTPEVVQASQTIPHPSLTPLPAPIPQRQPPPVWLNDSEQLPSYTPSVEINSSAANSNNALAVPHRASSLESSHVNFGETYYESLNQSRSVATAPTSPPAVEERTVAPGPSIVPSTALTPANQVQNTTNIYGPVNINVHVDAAAEKKESLLKRVLNQKLMQRVRGTWHRYNLVLRH